MAYVLAGANLHAFNYGLKGDTDPATFRRVLGSMKIPHFEPKSGVKIQINETDPVANNDDSGCHMLFTWNRTKGLR